MPVYKYKIKNGTKYYYKICIDSHQYIKRGFNSVSDAKKGEAIFMSSFRCVSSVPHFHSLCDEYLERYKLSRKISSYVSLKKLIDRHFKGFFKDVKVDKLTYYDFYNFRSYLKKSKLSKSNYLINLLKDIFKYCDEIYGYRNLQVNRLVPFSDYRIDKNFDEKVKVFSLIDFKAFYDHINSDYFKLLFLLGFISGLRISEIRGIQVESIKNNNLYIYQQACDKLGIGKSTLISLKSKTSKRIIVLFPLIINMINDHIHLNKLKSSNFLFYSPLDKNKPIGETSINRVLKQTCLDAGIKPFSFHAFRHNEASFLFEKGIDENILKDYLGHSSIDVTKKYYIHDSVEKQKVISDIMEMKIKKIIE